MIEPALRLHVAGGGGGGGLRDQRLHRRMTYIEINKIDI